MDLFKIDFSKFTFSAIPSELIIITAVLLVLSISITASILIFFSLQKGKISIKRGMKLGLFLIALPRTKKADANSKASPLEETFKIAEQFYASLINIKEKGGMENFLLGNIYMAFEIAVHKTGEEIFFYFACPKNFGQLMEKQILAFWPDAQVQPTGDYNIFNFSGQSAGAEAHLDKNVILPLRSYQELKIDTLSPLTSVLTKLEKNQEGAAIQVIFKPSKRSIKKEANKAIDNISKGGEINKTPKGSGPKKGQGTDIASMIFGPAKNQNSQYQQQYQQPSRLNPVQEQIMTEIARKSSQPLFDVNLRLLTSAKDEQRAKIILDQLINSFEQLSSPVANSIKFRNLSKGGLKNFAYKFSFRIFDPKKTMLLSSGELAEIFHLPSSELATPNVKWVKAKQAPPPANLPQEGMVIGKSVFRAEERKACMLEKDRLRHLYMIGQTGTGKSALIKEMVRQDIENGEGVALIDPHGDLAEGVLSTIPASRAEDVVYFNPSDFELPMGLNMLEYDSNYPESKTFVVNELLEIFEKLYSLQQHGFGGPMFEQYMRNAILLIMEDPDSGNTLVEIPKVLSDINFRKYKLSKCKNIIVKNFWEQEAEKAGGEASLANMVPYITSKMNVFIANDLMRPIISQQKSAFNLRDIMDNKKILIVNLAKGKLGDTNSFLLGMVIVGKILMAAFSRADIPEEQRKNFFLYIDEFQNVTTKTISSILAEARKYCLGMIFGHQFIGQLDEITQKAVFGNVGSIMAFRVGPDDAKYLVTQFQPVFDETDLVNLDNYNAALRLLINGQTTLPFNIQTYPPVKGDIKTADAIKELSRRKYGKNRGIVETELNKRLKQTFA
jgi:hypothetical protein